MTGRERLNTVLLVIILGLGFLSWKTQFFWMWMERSGAGKVLRAVPVPEPLPRALASDTIPPLSAAEALELRALLARNLDSTDQVLGNILEQSKHDVSGEWRAWDALSAFRSGELPLLDRWAQGRPQSVPARLARATTRVSAAFATRGAGARREVSDAQWQSAKTLLDGALLDLREALTRDPQQVLGYALLMWIAQFYGEPGPIVVATQRAVNAQPLTFVARERAMNGLLPRWGGGRSHARNRPFRPRRDPYRRMNRVAEDAQKHAGANPALRALRGYTAWDRADLAWLDDDTLGAREQIELALSMGTTFRFCLDRARERRDAGDVSGALEGVACALRDRPSHAPVRLMNARLLADQMEQNSYTLRTARAPFLMLYAEADTAYLLDSTASGVREFRVWTERVKRENYPEMD